MKQYKYKINGNAYNVTVKDINDDNIACVEVNGTIYKVEVEREKRARKKVVRPISSTVEVPKEAVVKPATAGHKSAVKSPLPGSIIELKVKVGDTVTKGQTIAILEAMKMENCINAERAGEVKEICVSKGESVLEGTDLIVIE